jgi:integrase
VGNSDLPASVQIFRTAAGRPVNSDYLARCFKRVLLAAGLATMRLYDLRHTAASLALSAGVSPKVVSEQLGHASSAFTLDTYSHVLPHLQSEAAGRVEALLFPPGSVTRTNPARLTRRPNRTVPQWDTPAKAKLYRHCL